MVDCIDYYCDNKFERKGYFYRSYFVIVNDVYYSCIVFYENENEGIDYFGY